jgi:hypothetical protein
MSCCSLALLLPHVFAKPVHIPNIDFQAVVLNRLNNFILEPSPIWRCRKERHVLVVHVQILMSHSFNGG